MKYFRKIFRIRRILAIVILIAAIRLAYLYYGNIYNIIDDKQSITDALGEYLRRDNATPEVEYMQKDAEWIYVIFSDSHYGDSFMGLARLRKGRNDRYVIYDSKYGSGCPVTDYILRDDINKIAIYGLLPDNRAERYEILTHWRDKIEVLYSGEINEKTFIHIYDNVNKQVTGVRLYDANENDITESYINQKNIYAPNATRNTAELFMVDFISGAIIVIGSIFAIKLFRIKKKETDLGYY